MKHKIAILILVVSVIIALNFLFTKKISQWIVSPKFETTHLAFFSSSGDLYLVKNISKVVERDYNRLCKNYKAEINEK